MSQQQCHAAADISTWEQAQRWLYDRIDYERVRPSAQSNPFRLDRLRQMLGLIGSPQESIPAIHIAGTKGKGSTAAMLDSILRCSGIRSGLFTSPHIVCFEERMRVNGVMPTPEQFIRLVRELALVLETHRDDLQNRPPTFFEVTTLLGWMYFAEQRAEVVVLETGLGGRLDCTNVCSPWVTIITSIGLDHTHILGNTIEEIAAEKAGILKPGVPVIQGQLPAGAATVVRSKALETHSPLFVYGTDFQMIRESPTPDNASLTDGSRFSVATAHRTYQSLSVPLDGVHQLHNAALAVMAASLLSESRLPTVTGDTIRRGLASTWWPLRFEVFHSDPVVILDAAHNEDSIAAVLQTLRQPVWQSRRRTLVFASSLDKDAATMLRLAIPEFDAVILTRFTGNPRSTPPGELYDICRGLIPTAVSQIDQADTPEIALGRARERSGPGGLVCVTGSLFLAAEARAVLCGNVSPFAPDAPSHDT